MLDAGRAKKERRDPHIKHVTDFEPRAICKLLNSPDYLGRAYSRKHTNPEKYIKNKQICKLIDNIRYGTGSKEKDCSSNHAAKLHYKGFIHKHLNGGNASTLYKCADKLDLGDAGPECYEGLINSEEYKCETELEHTRYNSAHLHYKGFNYSNIDGGNAKSSYSSANKLNLGDAGAECYEPFVPCNVLEETHQSANLHYRGFIDPNLDGGSAKSSYTLANKLNLGDAGNECLVPCDDNFNNLDKSYSYANLHYKGYIHSKLDGGNSKSSYSLANKLNLGDAGTDTLDTCNKTLDTCNDTLDTCNALDKLYPYANLHYKGFIHSNVDGGIAKTSYTSGNKLDLGNAGIECYQPLVSSKYNCHSILNDSQHSANLHYKEFLHSHLNGGDASSSYNSADKLDLGGAQLVNLSNI